MKVEVLCLPDCPSRLAAVTLVTRLLAERGLLVPVAEILVRDEKMAAELKFAGSPTIRINGRDVAGDPSPSSGFSLACRLYPQSEHVGLPPGELVRRAVAEACAGERS